MCVRLSRGESEHSYLVHTGAKDTHARGASQPPDLNPSHPDAQDTKHSRSISKSAGVGVLCAVRRRQSSEQHIEEEQRRQHAFRAFIVSDDMAFAFSASATFTQLRYATAVAMMFIHSAALCQRLGFLPWLRAVFQSRRDRVPKGIPIFTTSPKQLVSAAVMAILLVCGFITGLSFLH